MANLCVGGLMVALAREEKHETKPTAKRMGKSNSKDQETIDFVRSASAWDRFTLAKFGVDFDPTVRTPFTELITNPKYYDPTTESPEFAERTVLCCKR